MQKSKLNERVPRSPRSLALNRDMAQPAELAPATAAAAEPYRDANYYSHDERMTLPALLIRLATYNPPFTACVLGVLVSFYRGLGAMRRSDRMLSNQMMRHRVIFQFSGFSFLIGKEYLNVVYAEADMDRKGAERRQRGEHPSYLEDVRLEDTVNAARLANAGWGGKPSGGGGARKFAVTPIPEQAPLK